MIKKLINILWIISTIFGVQAIYDCSSISTWNDESANLAADNNHQTAAKTGLHVGSWLRCQSRAASDIRTVQLNGDIRGRFQVRCGKTESSTADEMEEFESFSLCESASRLTQESARNFTCSEVYGNTCYVKIVDPETYQSITINELHFTS